MPLLTPTREKTTKTLKVNIDKTLAAKIDNYCQYAGIKKVDEFVEKAAEFVFNKDREWRDHFDAKMTPENEDCSVKLSE